VKSLLKNTKLSLFLKIRVALYNYRIYSKRFFNATRLY